MVERVLAKDETGVRFSLSAQKQFGEHYAQKRLDKAVFALKNFYGEVGINLLVLGIKDNGALQVSEAGPKVY